MQNPITHKHSERGFAMIIGLIIVLVMTTFSTALVFTSGAHHVRAKTTAERAHALALAEGAASLLLNDLDLDDKAPVKDQTNYTLSGTTFVREYAPFEAGDGTARVEVTYLVDVSGTMTPVNFASRSVATEPYDRVRAVVTAFRPGVERTIDVEMEQQFVMFDGAITSDAIPSAPIGPASKNDKNAAKDGHIVFNDKGRAPQLYVNGSILSNGAVMGPNGGNGGELTTANASDAIVFAGSIQTDLAGTPVEIPDYTSIGSQDQLFDFDRYIAAARTGGGREFTSLNDFIAAMNSANGTGKMLEGITVISIDDSVGKIETSDIPLGINIRGTLLFNFEPGTDPWHKLYVLCDVNVNPADISRLDPADPSTYTSGYDTPWWNDTLQAHNYDISGDGFKNFSSDDDMPAIMFNTGLVDQHGSTNISGLIYGPSFIELENKFGGIQYYNGAILGGAGVFVEGNKDNGYTVINFDRNTINKLATQGAKGKGLQLIGWRVRG